MPNLNRTPVKKAQNSKLPSSSQELPNSDYNPPTSQSLNVIQTNASENQPTEEPSQKMSLHELSMLDTDVIPSSLPKAQISNLFSQNDKSMLTDLLTKTNPNEVVADLSVLLAKFDKSLPTKPSNPKPSGIIRTSTVVERPKTSENDDSIKAKPKTQDSSDNGFPNVSFGDYTRPKIYHEKSRK